MKMTQNEVCYTEQENTSRPHVASNLETRNRNSRMSSFGIRGKIVFLGIRKNSFPRDKKNIFEMKADTDRSLM